MRLPRLGLGTWHMGESRARRSAEAQALRLGWTWACADRHAEMYAEGGAERWSPRRSAAGARTFTW